MVAKTQVVITAEPQRATELDVLRIVTGKARAEVVREALDRILPEMLAEHGSRIKRLTKLAAAEGLTVAEYVRLYALTFAIQTYPPALEALEQGKVTLLPKSALDKAPRTRRKAAAGT